MPRVVETEGGLTLEEARPQSIGRVKDFYGNFSVVVKALAYLTTLGREGVPEAAQNAVLNANYMMEQLKDLYPISGSGRCMHEFVMSLEQLKEETGVSAMDVAKSLLDYGFHPPTMYFPLIVHEALMIEPTETEPRRRWMRWWLCCDPFMRWPTKSRKCCMQRRTIPKSADPTKSRRRDIPYCGGNKKCKLRERRRQR